MAKKFIIKNIFLFSLIWIDNFNYDVSHFQEMGWLLRIKKFNIMRVHKKIQFLGEWSNKKKKKKTGRIALKVSMSSDQI